VAPLIPFVCHALWSLQSSVCLLLVNEYNLPLGQEATPTSYLASLNLLSGHDNDTSVLLPDHIPEV